MSTRFKSIRIRFKCSNDQIVRQKCYKFIFKYCFSVLGVGNQQDLSDDLECDPFHNTAMQRLTCDLYYRFGALLAPVSVGIITGKHYTKNSITKSNGRSNSGNCDPTEEPSEN